MSHKPSRPRKITYKQVEAILKRTDWPAMTILDQRVALAELRGINGPWKYQGECYRSPQGNYLPELTLGELHEAEKCLDSDQQEVFVTYLGAYAHCSEACWNAVHATTSQRAEALLRTIWKWKEE